MTDTTLNSNSPISDENNLNSPSVNSEGENIIAVNENNDDNIMDDADIDPTVAIVQYDITSYGADYDVEGLVKRLDRGDIRIPTFQRSYIWSMKEASRFIESLLLGLPVPGIFLAREDDNKLLVIDGQQRLKSLQFFFGGFFNPKPGDEKKQVFKLIEVQKEYEGKTYETLSESDRVRLNDSLIHATIIKQESPSGDNTSVYHIFDRINSEGRPLNPQEIRVAVYHGKLMELIRELNDNPKWRKIFGKYSSRLKDQELILRFLALYYESDKYQRPINEFLNKFAIRHQNSDESILDEYRIVFLKAINMIFDAIGRKAFRPLTTLNAAAFDSIMVGVAKRLMSNPGIDLEKLKIAYENLMHDEDYRELIVKATSDELNVRSRIKQAIEAFGEI